MQLFHTFEHVVLMIIVPLLQMSYDNITPPTNRFIYYRKRASWSKMSQFFLNLLLGQVHWILLVTMLPRCAVPHLGRIIT